MSRWRRLLFPTRFLIRPKSQGPRHKPNPKLVKTSGLYRRRSPRKTRRRARRESPLRSQKRRSKLSLRQNVMLRQYQRKIPNQPVKVISKLRKHSPMQFLPPLLRTKWSRLTAFCSPKQKPKLWLQSSMTMTGTLLISTWADLPKMRSRLTTKLRSTSILVDQQETNINVCHQQTIVRLLQHLRMNLKLSPLQLPQASDNSPETTGLEVRQLSNLHKSTPILPLTTSSKHPSRLELTMTSHGSKVARRARKARRERRAQYQACQAVLRRCLHLQRLLPRRK